MNSENPPKKPCGDQNQSELNFCADAMNLEPQFCNSEAKVTHYSHDFIKPTIDKDLVSQSFQQNSVLAFPQEFRVNQEALLLPEKLSLLASQKAKQMRQKELARKLLDKQIEIIKGLQNLKQFQKYFKNYGPQERSKLMDMMVSTRDKALEMQKKFACD